jgi:hypothetical protein
VNPHTAQHRCSTDTSTDTDTSIIITKMSEICMKYKRTFTKGSSLRRYQERFPSHSELAVSGVFEEYRVPRSPITDALCNADLAHLPAIEPERRELFREFVPRISSVENWKPSYSFDEIRRITLGDIMRSKNPISTLIVFS